MFEKYGFKQGVFSEILNSTAIFPVAPLFPNTSILFSLFKEIFLYPNGTLSLTLRICISFIGQSLILDIHKMFPRLSIIPQFTFLEGHDFFGFTMVRPKYELNDDILLTQNWFERQIL